MTTRQHEGIFDQFCYAGSISNILLPEQYRPHLHVPVYVFFLSPKVIGIEAFALFYPSFDYMPYGPIYFLSRLGLPPFPPVPLFLLCVCVCSVCVCVCSSGRWAIVPSRLLLCWIPRGGYVFMISVRWR